MDQANLLPIAPESEAFNFKDFMQFKSMITLKIIPIFYMVIAIFITLGGLAMMFGGRSSMGSMLPFGGFFGGLIFIVIGNVVWRMWCELILVLFTINRSAHGIERNTRKM